MKFHQSLFIAVLGVAVTSFNGQGQTTSPASETAADNSPRSAELKFELAICSGDTDAALRCAYFADEVTAKKATILLGEAATRFKAIKAIALKFPGSTKVPDEAMIQSTKETLAQSKVDVHGDSATIDFQGKAISYLVRDKGIWKVDFGRLAHENGDSKNDVEAAAGRLQIMEAFIADVNAGKFASAREASAAFQRIFSDAGSATKPSPAATQSRLE